MPKPPAFLYVLFGMLISSNAAQSQRIYLPANDPLNEKIFELQAQGYLDDLRRTARPWLVEDIIAAMTADEYAFEPAAREVAESIMEELRPIYEPDFERISTGATAGLGIRGLSRERREGYFYLRDELVWRNFRGEFGSVYRGRFWLSRHEKWGLDSELIFDSDGTGYPWYYGTAHNARIIGQFDRAYLNFAFDRFSLLFGRQRLSWGPSPRGSLILDDKSPPLDMIWYGFELAPISFSGFISRIDDYIDTLGISNRRFLTGHRIEIRPGKGWEFALSEIYLYGGPERLPELYYGLPLVLFYWEAQNRKQDDNAFWALDVSWVKKRLGHFYLHWVFDDIQRQHRGPQKFAIQVGTCLAPAVLEGWSGLFEFNFVDSYVYTQRKRINAYLNWERPIARLDSDQREYFAGVYRRIDRNLKAGLEFVGRDKGEIDAADFQSGMAPFGVKFPSGVVEQTKEIAFQLSCGSPRRLRGELRAGFQAIDNWQHRDSYSVDQFFATMQASIDFNFELPFWKKSS